MLRGYLSILVLKSLEDGSKTSYGIKEHIGEFWDKKPSSGSLFPVIQKLSCSNYIKTVKEENKKLLVITTKGKNHLSKLIDEKENTLVDHILFLKSFSKVHDGKTNIIGKIVQRVGKPLKPRFKSIQKLLDDHTELIRNLMQSKFDKEQEQEFKELYSSFLKKLKLFNEKINSSKD